MPIPVDTAEAARLLESGALFVEVLPASAYTEQHLPGAVSIPLTELTERAVVDLDRDRPLVVYCYDYQCDLSARAAARFEHLGFHDVHDYVASKTAWMAAGLPVEGASDRERHAVDVAFPSLPTATPSSTAGELRAAVDGWPGVAVVDERDVLLGWVRADALTVADETPASKLLQPGPATVRPSIPARELRRSMDEDGQDHVLVTHHDGVLVGLVRKADLGG